MFKHLLVFLGLLVLSTAVQATTANCTLKDHMGKTAEYQHTITEEGHGPIMPFDMNGFHSFISSANQVLVISINEKDSQRHFSVLGKMSEASDVVSGQIVSGDYWLQASCVPL